ncbi:hypothetical protein [Novosphingobium album (ex Liu et al. 2023)]|uniref:Lipoprotein n=1 Tax=Novosphingobium album (ex Liu et al. 2023) TaxID=3031130 RepID=A0ABT5WPY1_9SPHN|nr:hypothetical protein [Novosphingobium album (ex Liu et al. 2023)]MDE8652115.1 hypothetical protein [Novosphingobium album (ex Liu et al. 2023)]
MAVLPALALAGCGSSAREEELAQQLAAAQAEAKAAAHARKQAEAALARASQNDGALSDFYGDSMSDGDASPDDSDAEDGGNAEMAPAPNVSAVDGGDMPDTPGASPMFVTPEA